MKSKSIRDFILENRKELTDCVNRAIGSPEGSPQTLEELRLWVLNDEGLYRWARAEGVNV